MLDGALSPRFGRPEDAEKEAAKEAKFEAKVKRLSALFNTDWAQPPPPPAGRVPSENVQQAMPLQMMQPTQQAPVEQSATPREDRPCEARLSRQALEQEQLQERLRMEERIQERLQERIRLDLKTQAQQERGVDELDRLHDKAVLHEQIEQRVLELRKEMTRSNAAAQGSVRDLSAEVDKKIAALEERVHEVIRETLSPHEDFAARLRRLETKLQALCRPDLEQQLQQVEGKLLDAERDREQHQKSVLTELRQLKRAPPQMNDVLDVQARHQEDIVALQQELRNAQLCAKEAQAKVLVLERRLEHGERDMQPEQEAETAPSPAMVEKPGKEVLGQAQQAIVAAAAESAALAAQAAVAQRLSVLPGFDTPSSVYGSRRASKDSAVLERPRRTPPRAWAESTQRASWSWHEAREDRSPSSEEWSPDQASDCPSSAYALERRYLRRDSKDTASKSGSRTPPRRRPSKGYHNEREARPDRSSRADPRVYDDRDDREARMGWDSREDSSVYEYRGDRETRLDLDVQADRMTYDGRRDGRHAEYCGRYDQRSDRGVFGRASELDDDRERELDRRSDEERNLGGKSRARAGTDGKTAPRAPRPSYRSRRSVQGDDAKACAVGDSQDVGRSRRSSDSSVPAFESREAEVSSGAALSAAGHGPALAPEPRLSYRQRRSLAAAQQQAAEGLAVEPAPPDVGTETAEIPQQRMSYRQRRSLALAAAADPAADGLRAPERRSSKQSQSDDARRSYASRLGPDAMG